MAVYKSLATVGMYSCEAEATDRPEKIREQLHYAPHDRPQVNTHHHLFSELIKDNNSAIPLPMQLKNQMSSRAWLVISGLFARDCAETEKLDASIEKGWQSGNKKKRRIVNQ